MWTVEQQPYRAPAKLNHEIVTPFRPTTLNPKETETSSEVGMRRNAKDGTLKLQGYQSLQNCILLHFHVHDS
jgi:hypothetical protein